MTFYSHAPNIKINKWVIPNKVYTRSVLSCCFMLKLEVVLCHPQFRKEMMFPYFYNLRKIMYCLGGYSRSNIQWELTVPFRGIIQSLKKVMEKRVGTRGKDHELLIPLQ